MPAPYHTPKADRLADLLDEELAAGTLDPEEEPPVVTETHLVSWTCMGPWRKGPRPPNGCIPAPTERLGTQYTLYLADYGYGKGPQPYLRTQGLIQTGMDRWSPRLDPWRSSVDGSPERIRHVLEECGITGIVL